MSFIIYMLVCCLYNGFTFDFSMSFKNWFDYTFNGNGHHRQVNAHIGNLVRLHWPGLVTTDGGEVIPCTSWDHYKLAKDGDSGDAQGATWKDFWV